MRSTSEQLISPPVFVLLVPLLLPGLVRAGAGWRERKTGDGVAVHSREMPGSAVERIRGIVRLAYTTDEVARVMTDLPNQKFFVPHMKSIRVLKQKRLANGRIKQLLHQVNALPVLKDRDVVLEAVTWSKPQPPAPTWRSTFKAVSNAGPVAHSDRVRIRKLSGSWKIVPTRNGKGSVLTYICHTEVGGAAPDFVAELGQVGAIHDMLKNLRARCRKLYGAR